MSRSTVKIDAVFDIETEEWDRIVFAGIYYSDGTYRQFNWKDLDSFYSAILSIEGEVWAHFGGGFDIKAILDHCLANGLHVKIAPAGSLIRSARVGKTTIRDSFALFPASLASFTKGLGVSKESLNLPCVCGDSCGGYCSIRRNKPEHHARISQYLRADCESLYKALSRLTEWAERNDVDLKPTVGAAAWTFAKRRFSVTSGKLKGEDFAFARSAYYGGRCEVFRWGEQRNVWEYDVRSMYPWALSASLLPAGEAKRYTSRKDAAWHFARGTPGIYRAVVNVPPMHIPPLPLRTKKRIYYPTGVFSGTWALPELQYARDLGCEITATECLVFDTEKQVFQEWASEVFRLRHQESNGPDSSLGEFAKFLANSLTGKLGQNPDRWSYEINPPRITVCECESVCHCNPHIEVSADIYKQKVTKLSECMHPEWAAYLTAIARVKLHRMLSEKPDACYCDTDSVFAQSETGHPRTVPENAALGEFEFKGRYDRCYFAAPKVYEKDGTLKAKGIGKKARASGLQEATVYESPGIVGFGAGARKGRFFAKGSVKRRIRFHCGGRVIVSASGDTRPMTIDEVRIDEKKRDKLP